MSNNILSLTNLKVWSGTDTSLKITADNVLAGSMETFLAKILSICIYRDCLTGWIWLLMTYMFFSRPN